jgi:hypothetical protein
MNNDKAQGRRTVFISKATPENDEFVLWIAPKLEAAGYTVFADILGLKPGDRWRKEVTQTLQNSAVKMLLCCTDVSLAKEGVHEEIGIAKDVSRELNDSRFIVPLRIEPFKKLFGIGELQYINFVGKWANGLRDLLTFLEEEGVPQNKNIKINPNWEAYKKRQAIKIEPIGEVLTSNWVSINKLPETINYYQPSGAINLDHMARECKTSIFPSEIYQRGFFSFMSLDEVQENFQEIGKFHLHSKHNLIQFIENGAESPKIHANEAKNFTISIFRQAWIMFCQERELTKYAYANQLGFHVNKTQVSIGKRVSWGNKDNPRNSMLRNISKGKVWEYGVSVTPSLWPFPHFKLKSRVLFSSLSNKEVGSVFDEASKQHQFRRNVCSGWRNKAWHGRLMAFLKIISASEDFINIPVSKNESIQLDSNPITYLSSVSTLSSDNMDDDAEESDATTLGNVTLEDEDDA